MTDGSGAGPGPLEGITVVELGGFISAAYAARCLADLGARVIKVEPPDGDPARRHGPFPGGIPHPERSGLYCLLNTNKLGVTLALSEPGDRLKLARLLDQADVLVENLHPGEARAAELSPAETARRHPALIHCSVTTFGHRGPWSGHRGHALQAGAAGGAAVVIGEPGRAPLPLPCSQPDFQAGINAAAGAVLALLARRKVGRGQHVDVASADVMAFYGGITSPLYTATGLAWRRAGHRASGSGGFYPYTILPTRDGYLCMITRSGRPWRRFLDALGSPPWAGEPRYRDRAALGRQYPDEGDARLAPHLAERSSAELQELGRDPETFVVIEPHAGPPLEHLLALGRRRGRSDQHGAAPRRAGQQPPVDVGRPRLELSGTEEGEAPLAHAPPAERSASSNPANERSIMSSLAVSEIRKKPGASSIAPGITKIRASASRSLNSRSSAGVGSTNHPQPATVLLSSRVVPSAGSISGLRLDLFPSAALRLDFFAVFPENQEFYHGNRQAKSADRDPL